MTAKQQPRITTENRTRLETVIPLDTPYLVFLDPSSLCNAKCAWCPTGVHATHKYYAPTLMDWDLYCKIIGNLAAMPNPIKTLRLYKIGEPLLHPLFPEMVRYAKETGRFGQVDSTTNGLLLGEFMMKANVIASGLDKLFISVPQVYSTDYVANVRRFYERSGGRCQVYVKIIGTNLSDHRKDCFLADFKDISDRIFIENLINCWPDFHAGSDPPVGIYGNPLTDVQTCPYPFYSLTINSDGTASACFLDWPQNLILGDLKTESFADIWRGVNLRKFQKMQLQGRRRGHFFCGDCHQLTHGSPDNIDPYAKDLIKKLDR